VLVNGQITLGALALVLGRLVLVLAHDLAHALTLTAVGRSISVAGLKLVIVFPYAFVDTSEAWFEPRRHRIAVALAGPASDVVLAGLCSIVAVVAPGDTAGDVAFQVALAGYLGAFYNLNPLLERDGYHALVDLLHQPDLRRRFRERLAGIEDERDPSDPDALKRYAVATLVWTVLAIALTATLLGRHRERLANVLGDTPALTLIIVACVAVTLPLLLLYVPPLYARLQARHR
jgi:putative peptide zinc metalloprotease protein